MSESYANKAPRSYDSEAATIIASGGVIAFRTDTFYGLGADPLNEQAVNKIRRLKGREETKPILLLISDATEIDRFITTRSKLFEAVIDRFWPGPLTVVGAARPELPTALTAGSETIGVRLPANLSVRDFVRICGGTLTATSANLSRSLPARSAAEVEANFPEGIDLIIDSGEVIVDQPSTVIDLSGAEPIIIREGAVSTKDLEEFLATQSEL